MTAPYCPLPFKHVFVEPRGIKPCCAYTQSRPGTIKDWIASDELQSLQHNILQGVIDPGCASCISNEANDGVSTRLSAVKDYDAQRFEATAIDNIDYRSKNICNFKCRSCQPYFSNGIAQEARNHPALSRFYSSAPDTKLAATDTDDYQWVIDNIHSIKKLMFTGGEPTKIAEVRTIIDYIRANDILDISIIMVSNASFTDQYWFDITREMPNINWTLSIDAVGAPAELIRNGTDWTVVSRNVETMFDISPSVNISTVITNLSLLHTKDLFYWLNNLSNQYQHRHNGRSQFINICNWPQYLVPYNWPPEMVPKALEYLRSIDSSKLTQDQTLVIDQLVHNIQNNKFNQKIWDQGQEYNRMLDQVRSEDHSLLYQF